MVTKVRLVNIEAFKDVSFNFSTDTVNVFEAPNETGKSILFKVMRLMCDANWFGKGKRKDLIRNHCNKGVALFIVTKEYGYYRIQFEIYRTYQMYKLYDGKELVQSWKSDVIPSILMKILKWNYDRDSKRLLNLCDQELEMPFTGGDGRANFESMNFIFNSPELNTARENLSNWISELDNLENSIMIKQTSYYTLSKSTDFIDTNSLNLSIKKRERILKEVEPLSILLKALGTCCELNKPEFRYIDGDRIESLIEECQSLRKFGLTLQDVLVLRKPKIENVDCDSVNDIIDMLKILNITKYRCNQLMHDLGMRVELYKNVEKCNLQMKEFEEEHKLCPLCGSEFNK